MSIANEKVSLLWLCQWGNEQELELPVAIVRTPLNSSSVVS